MPTAGSNEVKPFAELDRCGKAFTKDADAPMNRHPVAAEVTRPDQRGASEIRLLTLLRGSRAVRRSFSNWELSTKPAKAVSECDI